MFSSDGEGGGGGGRSTGFCFCCGKHGEMDSAGMGRLYLLGRAMEFDRLKP